MPQIIQGHFNGTGADLYLCLGSIPLSIKLWNLEAATPVTLEWSQAMLHDSLTVEGILRPANGGAVEDLAYGEGVSPYYGKDVLTTTTQTSTTYGEGVYLERDDTDYRYYTNAAAGISGDASTTTIDTWTLDTSGTPSGHFNGDVTGTYIGDGSIIRIIDDNNKETYEATITSLSAGQGVSSDEVSLSWAIPSGKVYFIGGKYGYKPVEVGKTTKKGIRISNTDLNVNDQTVGFEAILAA